MHKTSRHHKKVGSNCGATEAEEGNKIQKCCKSMSPLVVWGFSRWYTWLDITPHLRYVTSSISRAPMLCSLLMASLMASSDGGCSSLPSTSCSKYTKSRYLRSAIRVTTSISSLHIFNANYYCYHPRIAPVWSCRFVDGGLFFRWWVVFWFFK